MTFLNYHYILTGQKNYAGAVCGVPAALLRVETELQFHLPLENLT